LWCMGGKVVGRVWGVGVDVWSVWWEVLVESGWRKEAGGREKRFGS
jgi:hypothetical protein